VTCKSEPKKTQGAPKHSLPHRRGPLCSTKLCKSCSAGRGILPFFFTLGIHTVKRAVLCLGYESNKFLLGKSDQSAIRTDEPCRHVFPTRSPRVGHAKTVTRNCVPFLFASHVSYSRALGDALMLPAPSNTGALTHTCSHRGGRTPGGGNKTSGDLAIYRER
jgi:hypothetical protein